MTSHSILAIIPARAGSKRLPKKNILKLAKKPLLAWTIEAASKVRQIDEIVVSTDDKKIAEISKNFGAKIPYLRPKALATDEAKTVDVVLDVVNYYNEKLNRKFDVVIVLQPTSPLRKAKDIKNALNFFLKKKANAVISVCETDHSPKWANKLPKNLSMNSFLKSEVINTRSQDLEKYYRLNGAIYIIKTERLLVDENLFPKKKSFAFIMPTLRSIDIDTEIDFNLAEIIIKKRQSFK